MADSRGPIMAFNLSEAVSGFRCAFVEQLRDAEEKVTVVLEWEENWEARHYSPWRRFPKSEFGKWRSISLSRTKVHSGTQVYDGFPCDQRLRFRLQDEETGQILFDRRIRRVPTTST